MKLDDKILEQFDLNPMVEREPVNVMKVSELLDFMEESATRLVTKSNQFFKAEDADHQADCLDIVSNRLNDFVQVFIDLLIFIRKEEKSYNGKSTSLRYCITSYDTLPINQEVYEKQFLTELLLRNEITHDYFNREVHRQKLIGMMQNCMEGAEDVFMHLKEYCIEKGLMEKIVDRCR